MEIRFFMIFTQIRKRKMIQIKGIQDYFSLKERPEQKRHVKTWQEQLLFCMNIKKRLSDVYSTYVIDALSFLGLFCLANRTNSLNVGEFSRDLCCSSL